MKRYILFVALMWLFVGCQHAGVDHSADLIVIDAGHGGHDEGATCSDKCEKDVVLQIAKVLREAFEDAGYRVYLTRGSDKYLTLGQRTHIADKLDAKVFISIHTNAIAHKRDFEEVSGIETYFLQKTRNRRSQRIAAIENASLLKGTDALSKEVIVDSVINGPKIIESNKLAIDVHRNIIDSLRKEYRGVKDGGVKPAPFYVLAGASRPSILVEVGYITNTKERERLFDKGYQETLAEGIVKGVNRYLENRKKELGF